MSDEQFDKNQTVEEFEKVYKKRMSFALIKSGKIPIRKGLLRNVCYLSGLGQYYRGISSTGQGRKGYNRMAEIVFDFKSSADQGWLKFLKKYISTSLSSYFGDCIVDVDSLTHGRVKVEYKSNDIKWYLIDYELNMYHDGNFYTRNNFCYIYDVKKDTDKTNSLKEIKNSFDDEVKAKEYISFLQKRGYKVLKT